MRAGTGSSARRPGSNSNRNSNRDGNNNSDNYHNRYSRGNGTDKGRATTPSPSRSPPRRDLVSPVTPTASTAGSWRAWQRDTGDGGANANEPAFPSPVSDPHLSIENATFAWPGAVERAGRPTLSNVNLGAAPGEILGIVGPVGAGKSSLLHAVLGELQPTSGSVAVRGTVAYCSQMPWILAGTVRSNITFFRPYDEDWFQTVVRACALERDLTLLPDADMTEIGEKGINLSGGQKARIGLARAVYARPQVLLLDDPLSAVDPAVARHLFDKVIRGNVLANMRGPAGEVYVLRVGSGEVFFFRVFLLSFFFSQIINTRSQAAQADHGARHAPNAVYAPRGQGRGDW
jgi:ABC-type multidrug transport system fused ATPase/permease subunit